MVYLVNNPGAFGIEEPALHIGLGLHFLSPFQVFLLATPIVVGFIQEDHYTPADPVSLYWAPDAPFLPLQKYCRIHP